MKRVLLIFSIVCMLCALSACQTNEEANKGGATPVVYENVVDIALSDSGITVAGAPIGTDSASAVYAANDIVYYEAGKDFTYGEGAESEAHTAEQAAAHTVVHITKAGTYRIEGKLSKGQIAVDLGENAKKDPSAVVTLVLNGTDITCEVAPAVIFYRVYECGSTDAEGATRDVNTDAAGANVIIADGSENVVNGSHVARIYKPGTVVLNADGTAVEDAKKLHKYDAAFYSKMTMNVNGEPQGTGKLTIKADNEGLDSELHLTVNGGIIDIYSGNDGINTNEDGISVTTINGGELTLTVTGKTGEGDGIDSNGWLVINGGTVKAYACAASGDAGIDSDLGIYINGGTVIATGNMLDKIAGAAQNCAIFQFTQRQSAGSKVALKGCDVPEIELKNDCSILIVSAPELKTGSCELYVNDVQYGAAQDGAMGGFGGMMPDGTSPEMPEGQPPTDMQGGQQPQMPEGQQPPEVPEGGMQPPENGGMGQGGRPNMQGNAATELSVKFEIREGVNTFNAVSEYTGGNGNIVWIVVICAVVAGLAAYAAVVTVKLLKNKKSTVE